MKKNFLITSLALMMVASVPSFVQADDTKKPNKAAEQTTSETRKKTAPFIEAPDTKEQAIKVCRDKFTAVLKDLSIDKFDGFQSKGNANHRQLYKMARANLELTAMETLPQKTGYKSNYRSCLRTLAQVDRSLKKKEAEAPQPAANKS